MRPKVVAVDFDGVIGEFTRWKGLGQFGAILPGCREELQKLRDAGWYIIIFTTRGTDAKALMDYLTEQKVPWDSFNQNHPETPPNNSNRKVLADVYIDDRAIPFTGSWDGIANKILDFTPHYKKTVVKDLDLYLAISDLIPVNKNLAVEKYGNKFYDMFMPFLIELINGSRCSYLITDVNNSVRALASYIDLSIREKAKAVFIERNGKRGGAWRDTGAVGACIELHAKLARLRFDPSDEDSLIDTYNYCIIFLMCLRLGRIDAQL